MRLRLAAVGAPALAAMAPASANAGGGTVVVDADVEGSDCPGSGSENDPYGSLQCALEQAALAPGVRIQLRDAAVPYAGADTDALSLANGTAAAPIVIEPAPGHAPILSGALALRDAVNWHVRGLVFDGSGGDAGGDALSVLGGRGVVVEQVVIAEWSGRGVVVRGADATVLRNNRIDGALGHAIWIEDASDTLVEDNDVGDVICEPITFELCTACGADACVGCGDCLEAEAPECTEQQTFTVGGQVGARVLDSNQTELVGNRFHDFAGGGCGPDATNAAAVFITGSGATGGRVHRNLVERITPDGGPAGVGHAILMFQEASGWRVDHNIVVDPGVCGLCEGNWLFHGGVATAWEHNTVLGGAVSVDVRRAADARFVSNLLVGARDAAARVHPDALDAAPSFDHNLHFGGPQGDVVGSWGDSDALTLAQWQSACECDAASLSADPVLASAGASPAAASPAIDLGAAGESAFHGDAPDAGALEPPRLRAATVPADAPTTVLVDLDNRAAPPLAPGSCAAVSITVDAVPVAPQSCAAAGDEQIVLELSDPIVAGQEVRVIADGSTGWDSARIGGRIDAVLAATELVADNRAPPAGVGTSEGGGSDGAATDAGEVEDGEAGCGCAARRSGSGLAVFAGILLGIARRRRTVPR